MTDYNDGKIHGWNGGDCPVHPDTVVKVWFDGQLKQQRKATFLRWSNDRTGLDTDIIAFQVVKQFVEPKVLWVNEYAGVFFVHENEEIARENVQPGVHRIAVKYQEVKDD